MHSRLYRKSALEKLSSPEQLDQLMQVTTSKGWMALIALGGLILGAVLWGIFGSLPTKVEGQGILIKGGGVFNITPLGSGQVIELLVQEGDRVEKNQVVARIAQPVLLEEIEKAEAGLAEMKLQLQQSVEVGIKEIKLQEDYLTKQSANLQYSIKVAEEQLKWLEEKIAVQEQLLGQGLITRQTLLNTRQSYYSTKEELERIRNELNQIRINELSLKNRKQQEQLSAQTRINEAERVLDQLRSKLELTSKVVSPYTGRILEVLTNEGSLVQVGEPIYRLDLIGENIKELEAVIYIAPADGKKIMPGMEIQIEPSTVKREEYGFILGKVIRVAQFPSTPQGMMRVLKNNQLVNEWSKQGAPFEIYADLIPDPTTESRYKWSSSQGPPLKIYSGTLCEASIIVRRQRPVSLVIPLLREYTGI